MDEPAVTYKKVFPEEYLRRFVEQNIRPDGRDLLKIRNTSVHVGSITTADGSALVRMGNTSVLCGIKAEMGNPPVDSPNEGYFVPNVTMTGLSASHIQRGPPSEVAQALSHFLLTTIKSAKTLNLGDLIIIPTKLCWILFVDVIVLDGDGNLTDACMLSVLAALKNVLLPRLTEVSLEDLRLPSVVEERSIALNLHSWPISVSFALFDGKFIIADPTFEEEEVAGTTLTIVLNDSKSIFSIAKPSPTILAVPISQNTMNKLQLAQCMSRAGTRAKEVMTLLMA